MNAVSVAIPFRVIHYLAIRHQIHHYLERVGCGAEARDNIRVFQSHPHGDLSTPHLELVNRKNELGMRRGGVANLLEFLSIILGGSHRLDTHSPRI